MGFTFEEFPNSDYYDSDLREILKYMKEFESKLAGYDEVIANLQRELDNIGGLYTRVDALEQATSDLDIIRQNIATLTSGLEALSNKEKADIDDLQRQLYALEDRMSSFENDVKQVYSYINYHVAVLGNEIKRQVNYLMGIISDLQVSLQNEIDYIIWRLDQIDTSVLNPWHTTEGRISQDRNVKHIYADLADGCLTAGQYAGLGYTAEQYTEFGITARQYAKFGKKYLRHYWVYSPVFGWRQDINNVLTSIVNMCKKTIPASVYSELGLTADDYSALGLTAVAYYSYNPEHSGVYVEDGILQTEQYFMQVNDGVLEFAGVDTAVEDGVLMFE